MGRPPVIAYGQASSDRCQADAASTVAALQLSADASMFTGWLQARAAGDTQVQAGYVRRFTPDYRDAYQAWLKTDPFVNPAAPSGAAAMPSAPLCVPNLTRHTFCPAATGRAGNRDSRPSPTPAECSTTARESTRASTRHTPITAANEHSNRSCHSATRRGMGRQWSRPGDRAARAVDARR